MQVRAGGRKDFAEKNNDIGGYPFFCLGSCNRCDEFVAFIFKSNKEQSEHTAPQLSSAA
ncbi:MAG: hypothetical protein Q9P14_03965 [candidate division KSB1 bacterium]|nr:hypothetical protein [candidate division KSB1 bacterium]